MKRICFIEYDVSAIGGVEQVTASVANALSQFYEVFILTICGEAKSSFLLDEKVNITSLNMEPERLLHLRKKAKNKIAEYLKEEKIDVAFATGSYAGFITGAVCRLVDTKMVFCDHGALINQLDDPQALLIRLINSIQYAKTTVLTLQNYKDYRKRLLTPKRKLVHITNWISDELPISKSYNADSKKILSAGRFSKEKGFDMLIKAFATVAKLYPDWSLDLYGDGEMMDTVKSLIKGYDISDSVNLMGMRSDFKEYYKDYAMYVMSSSREGLPLVLLESKANRLPIISFDIMTGPADIVRDGVDGILVPPFDLEKMSKAMIELIENPRLRQSMSEKSQENIDKFSKTTILEQWCKLIESL